MGQSIPRDFHFVFGLLRQTKPFHLLHYLCLRSCLEVNQPETIYFHCRHEPYGRYWDLIKESVVLLPVGQAPSRAGTVYRDQAIRYYSYAHAADFVRLERLLDMGGVYADLDTIFVNPLPDRLFEESFVMGREERQDEPDTLCNALLMSRRNATFGRLWRRRMEEEFDGTWNKHSCVLPQTLSEERPDLIHVEPARSFFHFGCSRQGVQAIFENCCQDLNGIYSIHLWHHVWAARWRREFTHFHEKRLTEAYVRDVDTTYNIVARRFLPGVEDDNVHVADRKTRPAKRTPGWTAPIDRAVTRCGLWAVGRMMAAQAWRGKSGR